MIFLSDKSQVTLGWNDRERETRGKRSQVRALAAHLADFSLTRDLG